MRRPVENVVQTMAYVCEPFGIVAPRYGVKLVSCGTSVRFRFSSPLSSQVVVCGQCWVILSLTSNETLKSLTSLPILMKESFW